MDYRKSEAERRREELGCHVPDAIVLLLVLVLVDDMLFCQFVNVCLGLFISMVALGT